MESAGQKVRFIGRIVCYAVSIKSQEGPPWKPFITTWTHAV